MRGSNHRADYFNRRSKTNRWGLNPCMEGQLNSGIVERASIRRSQAGPSHPIRPSRPGWLQMRVGVRGFLSPSSELRTPGLRCPAVVTCCDTALGRGCGAGCRGRRFECESVIGLCWPGRTSQPASQGREREQCMGCIIYMHYGADGR